MEILDNTRYRVSVINAANSTAYIFNTYNEAVRTVYQALNVYKPKAHSFMGSVNNGSIERINIYQNDHWVLFATIEKVYLTTVPRSKPNA